MSRWCAELQKIPSDVRLYALSMAREEGDKRERLEGILEAAGVAPHAEYTFALPAQLGEFIDMCRQLEVDGWLLTVRVVAAGSRRVVYRILDADTSAITAGLRTLAEGDGLLATVTPNRIPTVSGTMVARDGNAVMELVAGPHHWLTKAAPVGNTAETCWFTFPHVSVRYSTADPRRREILYQHLTSVTRIGLNLSLRQLAEARSSIYAEFQWDRVSGYRFFDISYSWVWTGSSAR
jgi:hypothetical protein